MSQITPLGQKMMVTLEMADGKAWTGKVVIASISMDVPPLYHQFLDGDDVMFSQDRPGWSMTLEGHGDLSLIQRAAFIGRTVERQAAPEWECAFCGAVMGKAKKQCAGCGGWRSFVYDV